MTLRDRALIRQDAAFLKNTARSGASGMDKVEAFDRLMRELPELVDALEKAEATIESARHARRNLSAALIASAHLLDQPFSNSPLSPWTRSVKPALSELNTALGVTLADLPDATVETETP